MPHPWYVYIVRCTDASLYTGIAMDVEARVLKHNLGTGAKYVRGRGPVKLVWVQRMKNGTEARKREAEIKGWTKEKKECLLSTYEH